MNKNIFLDLDGVMVNFDLHFKSLHGKFPKEVGEENFWNVFNTKKDKFFLNCNPYDGHLDFLDKLEKISKKYQYNLEILTAIPRRSSYPEAKDEKREWLNINGMKHVKMNIGPYAIDKQNWCKPGDILIDDNVRNVTQWSIKGGIVIFHQNFDLTLEILEDVMTSVHGE